MALLLLRFYVILFSGLSVLLKQITAIKVILDKVNVAKKGKLKLKIVSPCPEGCLVWSLLGQKIVYRCTLYRDWTTV